MWVLMLAVISACSKPQDTSTPDALAKSAFQALVKNDVEAYKRLMIGKDDLPDVKRQVVAKAKSDISDPKKLEEKLAEFEKEFVKLEDKMGEMIADNVESFHKTRGKAEKQYMDWNNAEFGGVEYKIREHRDGVKQSDIYFFVKSKDKLYRFKLDDCLELKRGWVNGDGLRYRRAQN